MAFDYNAIRDEVAIPLIREFGQPVTLYRTEDTTTYTRHYDPTIMEYYWEDDLGNRYDEEPSETQVEYEGMCIAKSFDLKVIDGTLIQADDLLLIAVEIPRPREGDIFLVNGIEYQHVQNMPSSPAGIDIVQKVQVRV
jgi:hypothetical protein